MINWNNYDITIDESAKIQLDHYFNDLGRILDNQNLAYKKEEVFNELESHIIDYIQNKDLEKITFRVALEIITELGPPDEYTEYSTLPDLINSVSNKNSIEDEIPKIGITNYVLCENCGEKNEEGSLFCIKCGKKLNTSSSNKNKVESYIELFSSKTYYFFNMLSIYLFVLALLSSILLAYPSSLANLLLLVFVVNEMIVIPAVYLLPMIIKKKKVSSGFELFLAQFLKIGIAYTPIPFIFPIIEPSGNLFLYAYVIYLLLVPILVTLILFYTRVSKIINRLILGTTGKNSAIINFVLNSIVVCFGLFFIMLNFINLNTPFTGNTMVGLDTLLIIIYGIESLLLYLFNFQKVNSNPYSYQI